MANMTFKANLLPDNTGNQKELGSSTANWKIYGNLIGNADTATTASKLSNTTKIGDTNKPVYFKADGTPAAISYTIGTNVPSNAVFSDTTSFTITANATDGLWDLTGTNGTNAVTYSLAPYSSRQSKASFDNSTTNPNRTDRLNYNGYFYATKLYSNGTEVLTSHQDISNKKDKSDFGTINSNKLLWTNDTGKIVATNHYANASKIGINTTDDLSGKIYTLYTNGYIGSDSSIFIKHPFTKGSTVSSKTSRAINFIDSSTEVDSASDSAPYRLGRISSVLDTNNVSGLILTAYKNAAESTSYGSFGLYYPNDSNNSYISWTSTYVGNNILPYETSTYDLGSSSKKWNNIYSSNILADTYDRTVKVTRIAGDSSTGTGFYIQQQDTNKNSISNYFIAQATTLGSATTTGITTLYVGNNKIGNIENNANGEEGNAKGRIRLYGEETAFHRFESDLTQDNAYNENGIYYRAVHLQNYAGPQYLIHGGSSNSIGSQYIPVYIEQNGRVAACSSNFLVQTGYHKIRIGNGLEESSEDKLKGQITLYGTGSGYHTLKSAAPTSFGQSVYFQAYNGDQYLTHTENASAVGSSSCPVYVDTNGRITTCSISDLQVGKDSDGNTIVDTYVKKVGDIMTGGLNFTGTSSSAFNTKGVVFNNGQARISVNTNQSNRLLGIYSAGNIALRPKGPVDTSGDTPSYSSGNNGIIISDVSITPANSMTLGVNTSSGKWGNIYTKKINVTTASYGNTLPATSGAEAGQLFFKYVV